MLIHAQVADLTLARQAPQLEIRWSAKRLAAFYPERLHPPRVAVGRHRRGVARGGFLGLTAQRACSPSSAAEAWPWFNSRWTPRRQTCPRRRWRLSTPIGWSALTTCRPRSQNWSGSPPRLRRRLRPTWTWKCASPWASGGVRMSWARWPGPRR